MEENSRMEIRRSGRKRKPRAESPLSDRENSKFPSSGPLFGGKFLRLTQVLDILENTEEVLDAIPVGDKTDVYFVIKNNTSAWKIHKGGLNAFPDDCGTWDRNKSTKVFQYIGKYNGSWRALVLLDNLFYEKTVSMPLLHPQPALDSVVKAHHYFAYHAFNVDFKRRITLLSGNGFREDRALVEYTGELKIRFTAPVPLAGEHHPPVKKRRVAGNERAIEPEVAEQDNLNESASRVSTVKLVMLSMLAESPSVQAIIGRKGQPQSVILYSDNQLSDMKSNLECENLIGVDCTHKIGACYLTMTVYQNARSLHKSTNEPMLALGPVYLHWDTEYSTYVSFFSHIMDKLEGLEPNIEVKLGNDVGLALFQALKFSFPASSYILDSNQLRKVVNKGVLYSCEGRIKERLVIIKKIFGLNGLTSSPTMFEFARRMSDLAPYFKTYPKLRNYFVKLRVLLYEYYIEPLQKGMYPKLWTGCRDEVLESHIQTFLPSKASDLPMLVRKLTSINTLLMQHTDDRCE